MSIADRIKIEQIETLSDNWYVLKKATYAYQRRDGSWQTQNREVYDRGDGVTVLLYDPKRRTVIFTKQFRFPAFYNGYDDLLIETPAGLLDDETPEKRIIAEAEEETGYRVRNVTKIYEAFMSPGAVTERVHFFTAEYSPADRVSDGGGHAHEGEDIEVLETGFDEALAMAERGEIIDGKTIMLIQHAALHIFR